MSPPKESKTGQSRKEAHKIYPSQTRKLYKLQVKNYSSFRLAIYKKCKRTIIVSINACNNYKKINYRKIYNVGKPNKTQIPVRPDVPILTATLQTT